MFTVWNLKSAITYKCGKVVLSHTSVYFAISKLILLFSHFFHLPCITKFIFTMYVSCFPFFLINHKQKQVCYSKSHRFFEAQKYFFLFFNFLNMVIFTTLLRRSSTLWNLTLKITKLFRYWLTLFISTLKLNVIKNISMLIWNRQYSFSGYWRTLLKDCIIC